jgi:hypothetical protein
MKIENGFIVEATESELFKYYLTRGYDDIMPFDLYLERMKEAGVNVIEDKEE